MSEDNELPENVNVIHIKTPEDLDKMIEVFMERGHLKEHVLNYVRTRFDHGALVSIIPVKIMGNDCTAIGEMMEDGRIQVLFVTPWPGLDIEGPGGEMAIDGSKVTKDKLN